MLNNSGSKEYLVTMTAWITADSDAEAAKLYELGKWYIDGHTIEGYDENGDPYEVDEE